MYDTLHETIHGDWTKDCPPRKLGFLNTFSMCRTDYCNNMDFGKTCKIEHLAVDGKQIKSHEQLTLLRTYISLLPLFQKKEMSGLFSFLLLAYLAFY